MRFQGWKRHGKFNPKYAKHFSRPRTTRKRADLLANVTTAAVYPGVSIPQSTAPLPGLLLRDSLPAGYIPTAVATGDFNGDGKMDFVVANGGDSNLWIYSGKGDGTFSLPVILPITLGQSPVWIATADLRGTGKTDLVVAEADSNSIGVFLGKGDGTFVESSIPLPGSAATLAIGDFNHDGKLDLAIPLNDTNSPDYIVVLPGKGNGTFGSAIVTPTALYAPETFWVSSADLNGDGLPDLVLTNGGVVEIALQVFINNGDGTFSAGQAIEGPVGGQLLSSVIFDGDEDGKPDLLFTDSYGVAWFAHGNGDGTFSTNPTEFGVGDLPYGLGVADLNGDGHLDLITSGVLAEALPGYGAEAGNLTSVLLGDGKGNFGPASVYRGDLGAFSLAIADFNGDGHPDIVTANQETDSSVLFLNDGHGGFGEPKGEWIGELLGPSNAPRSNMMSVDVDGDGKPDVVLMEWNAGSDPYNQLTVMLNEGSGNFSPPIRSDVINSNNSICFGDFVLADFRGTGLPDFLSIGCDAGFAGAPYISFAPSGAGGHFGAPTAATPAGAQGVLGVGDFNGDSKLDFVAATGGMGSAGQSIQVTTFIGNGDGTFKTGPSQTFGNTVNYPVAVYVGDFNRDGKPDILLFLESNGGFAQAQVYELLGKGDGSFQSPNLLFSDFGPMIVADVNNDGHPDIIESAYELNQNGILVPAQFSIYLGQADGSFVLSDTYNPYVYGSLIPQYGYSGPFAAEHYAPMIGDFNGDGNLDIAAFQIVPTNPDNTAIVQFMLGNGDGTFTPTFTTYDFQKYDSPYLAMDVFGLGHDDLVELDGLTSSFHVIPVGAGPTFQLALGGDPVDGSTGSGIVALAVASSSPTAISLSASDPAISVPATVTVPAGQASQVFSFSIEPGFNVNHVFALTAQLGTQTAVAYGTQVASGVKGFTISLNSSTAINLAAGQNSADYLLFANSLNGYSGTLELECLGMPGQTQCQFGPTTIPIPPGGGAQTRVMFSVPVGTAMGSYPIKLRATDGSLDQDIALTLNIGDFAMSLSPIVQQAFPTDAANYTLTLTSIDKYNGPVALTCTGLPVGATCPSVFNSGPQPGGFVLPFAITTTAVATGNYPFTITGESDPLSHSVSSTLQVWDFVPSVTPISATVSAGGSANFTVTVASANGFDGNVNLWCQALGNISCSFSPVSANLPANGDFTSTLTLTAKSSTASAGPRQSRVRLAFAVLGLPIGALLFAVAGSRQKWLGSILLLLVLFWVPSCGGGGSSGGGGGGGDGTSYSVGVMATSGSVNKSVGTITLTVK